MKKITLSLFLTCFSLSIFAQAITDTVSQTPSYAKQIWYSLENDDQGNSPKSNWDLAFDVTAFGSSIHINGATGTQLWIYPNGDTSAWSSVDTTGLSTWTSLNNSDTSWSFGAFDMTINYADPFDLGWGVYNMITHNTIGDSIYIIKLSDNSYKRLWIKSLAAASYEFTYANLSGGTETTANLDKADFASRYFGYYSILNGNEVNREPDSAMWDLTFMQYTAFIPQAYTVAGVLSSRSVQVAQADGISNPSTYIDWTGHSFSPEINIMGYDWKTFNGTGFDIAADRVYFVKTSQDEVWKVVFLDFGGSANGNYIFEKEKLSSTSVNRSELKSFGMSMYPNPSSSASVQVLYWGNESSVLNVYDVQGKLILQENLNPALGFMNHTLSTSNLNSGVYFVELSGTAGRTMQKLIVLDAR